MAKYICEHNLTAPQNAQTHTKNHNSYGKLRKDSWFVAALLPKGWMLCKPGPGLYQEHFQEDARIAGRFGDAPKTKNKLTRETTSFLE